MVRLIFFVTILPLETALRIMVVFPLTPCNGVIISVLPLSSAVAISGFSEMTLTVILVSTLSSSVIIPCRLICIGALLTGTVILPSTSLIVGALSGNNVNAGTGKS